MPLPELMEEVRDLFIVDSSNCEGDPVFRLPGLEEWRGNERHTKKSNGLIFVKFKTHLGTSCDGVPLGKTDSKARGVLPPLSLRLGK